MACPEAGVEGAAGPRKRTQNGTFLGPDRRGRLAMPPSEPCPHCGQLILDWHNE
jgi:hypothetical protein